jgi:hypothetical protein
MDTIKLWTSDYGQTIRARTYASDIGSATCVLRWKNLGSIASTTINGTVVVGDTDDDGDACYSVDFPIATSFLTARAGKWLCQVVATYTNAVVTSTDSFLVNVSARPTA